MCSLLHQQLLLRFSVFMFQQFKMCLVMVLLICILCSIHNVPGICALISLFNFRKCMAIVSSATFSLIYSFSPSKIQITCMLDLSFIYFYYIPYVSYTLSCAYSLL